MIQLSYVIVAHDEGTMLRTAVLSVTEAARASRLAVHWSANAPLALQIVIVLDNADDATRRCAESIEADCRAATLRSWVEVRSVESSFGEPGSARNVGLSLATGDLVGVLDGDDLVGKSFVQRALAQLVEYSRAQSLADVKLVLHPEHLFYFGTKTLVWRQPAHAEYSLHKSALIHTNLWDVTLITSRAVLAEHPFVAARVAEGTGYEDWEWSLTSTLAGIRHDIVPNTFCYKRAKRVSRFTRDNFHSVLIPTDRIDAVKLGRTLG